MYPSKLSEQAQEEHCPSQLETCNPWQNYWCQQANNKQVCRQISTTKQNVVRLQSVSIKHCLRSRSTQGECIRKAENGHFESSFTLLSAMSMAPRSSRVNMKLVSCSCGAFFHRTGHQSHSSPLGPPCWELQVSLPLGKDSTVTEERQKTKPGPFSSSAGSWERHRGAGYVERPWEGQAGVWSGAAAQGRRSSATIKEILCLKDPFSLSSGADTRHWLHFAFIKPSFGSRGRREEACWRVKHTSPWAFFHLP